MNKLVIKLTWHNPYVIASPHHLHSIGLCCSLQKGLPNIFNKDTLHIDNHTAEAFIVALSQIDYGFLFIQNIVI